MERPSVACVLPLDGRFEFNVWVYHQLAKQPKCQLVIVDSTPGRQFGPTPSHIRAIATAEQRVGKKFEIGIHAAQRMGAEWIALWSDDHWYAADYLSGLFGAQPPSDWLGLREDYDVVGYREAWFYRLGPHEARWSHYTHKRPIASLAIVRTSLAASVGWGEELHGTDTRWFQQILAKTPESRVLSIDRFRHQSTYKAEGSSFESWSEPATVWLEHTKNLQSGRQAELSWTDSRPKGLPASFEAELKLIEGEK